MYAHTHKHTPTHPQHTTHTHSAWMYMTWKVVTQVVLLLGICFSYLFFSLCCYIAYFQPEKLGVKISEDHTLSISVISAESPSPSPDLKSMEDGKTGWSALLVVSAVGGEWWFRFQRICTKRDVVLNTVDLWKSLVFSLLEAVSANSSYDVPV